MFHLGLQECRKVKKIKDKLKMYLHLNKWGKRALEARHKDEKEVKYHIGQIKLEMLKVNWKTDLR